MQQLPISGRNRNFQMLWNLIPGATPVTREHSEFFNAQDSMATRVNGQGRYANNVQIEGVDNNQRTGLLTVLIPPIEALQTVDVTTSNYDAELGRAGGAVTNVVLKSGTNDFHGSAYEFNRVNYLFARNYFSATPAPHTVFNQFGATFGGPIRKDKTFFFADFMLIRSRVGNFNQWTVPTMAFRSGDLSAALSIIYDPATGTPDGKNRTPFPNNRIPDYRISPIRKRILALIPPPTQPGLTNNWQGPTVLSKDTNAFDAKVDHRLGQWDNLSVRYDYSRPRVFDPGAYGNLAGGPRSGGFAGEGIQRAQSGAINYTHIFSPKFIADFRFGVMRYRNDAKNQDNGSTASDQIGIKGVNLDWFTSGLTGIDISGFGSPLVGFSPSLPWIRAETNFDFVSNWTRIRGNHTIKWGVDFRRNRDDLLQTQTYSPRGLWRFREGQTQLNGDPKISLGNSFASYLLDLPNDYGRDLPGIFPTFRQSQLFTYIQDKWQVGPKLTVDLGVRHEIYFAPTPAQRAGFSNYDPNTNSLILSGVGSNPDNLGINTPLKNFAPRLGIAYRFTDKMVIRAAFGLAFDPAYPDDKWAFNYPVKQNNAFNAANSYVTAGSMVAGFPAPPARGHSRQRRHPERSEPELHLPPVGSAPGVSRDLEHCHPAAAAGELCVRSGLCGKPHGRHSEPGEYQCRPSAGPGFERAAAQDQIRSDRFGDKVDPLQREIQRAAGEAGPEVCQRSWNYHLVHVRQGVGLCHGQRRPGHPHQLQHESRSFQSGPYAHVRAELHL